VRWNTAAGGLSLGRDLFSGFRAAVGPADLGAASLWLEAA
jgi:phosphogluconate dehydratase